MRRPALSTFAAASLALACGSTTESAPRDNWPAEATGPAGLGMGVRVFSGRAATLSTSRSCTSEEGAAGDRWCVFIGLSGTGDQNLFAVNVSQAMAGVPVSCDTPDPNCLLLTDRVFGSSTDFHPTFFGGDTLVYYDAALTPFAWRPGMPAGRMLASRGSTHDIAFCTPAPLGMVVACLALPHEQPDGAIISADLHVGAADGEAEPLLSRIDNVIVATREDSQEVQRFSLGFPASGHVAWSSRETPEGPEVLKVRRVDDPEGQLTVATDVHKWRVAPEAAGWFWLSAADEYGVGTLQTARFPDGAAPTDLLELVAAYHLDQNGTLVAQTRDRELVAFPDPVHGPERQVRLDGDVASIIDLSDGGSVLYTKRFASLNVNELLVASLDGTRSCVLETSDSVSFRSIQFSPRAGTVLWARSNDAGTYDAYHSRFDDCSTVPLSPRVAVLGWVGRSHVVFIDDLDAATSTGSLRFHRVGQDGQVHPDPPTLIAENVDTYATWGADFLLYTVSAGGDSDGAYVRAFGE